MKKLGKPGRPVGAERTPMPGRRPAKVIDDWADGEDMLEGLGGIDPDYDQPDDAVPPELKAQWRPSRFEGE